MPWVQAKSTGKKLAFKTPALLIAVAPSNGFINMFFYHRVSGQTVMTYPLTFSASEFYISHDLALLTDHIRTDISFVARRWRLRGRPTYCIIVKEANMRDHQFAEFLNLLLEIRSGKVDNVQISLGRLQNLMSSACIEHLDFSSSFDVAELDIEPFTQVQHSL